MVLSLAISLALAAQDVPDKASVIFTGIPYSREASSVQLVTHDAKAVLTPTDVTVDSLSFFKNASDKVQNLTVAIPIEGHDVTYNMPGSVKVTAMVDNVPVPVTASTPSFLAPNDQRLIASGVKAVSYHGAYTFPLNFVGRGAHSVRIHYSSVIGKAGLDGLQRIVAYDTSHANWNGGVGQFNFSLKYTPRVVFQVYAALPQEGWQIGPSGAFVKQVNFQARPESKYIFTYYPGGYDKIGG